MMNLLDPQPGSRVPIIRRTNVQLRGDIDGLSGLASEGAATAADPATRTSLATLLTRHILRDGELVLLILKPSRWYILLSCLRFLAAVMIFVIAARVFDEKLPSRSVVYLELGIFVFAGRLMWAVLQWMGQLYILTDMRIVRISGIFSLDIFDCPLRKVARIRLLYTMRERLFRLGSLEIIPSDEELPTAQWQMISHPREVHEQVAATINRAKHFGSGASF
jgi:hypothetical protein